MKITVKSPENVKITKEVQTKDGWKGCTYYSPAEVWELNVQPNQRLIVEAA